MKLTEWDMADHINDEEDVLIYLQTAFEEGDAADIVSVLGAIARSKGMAELAKKLAWAVRVSINPFQKPATLHSAQY